MKKILSLVLCLCIIMSLVPFTASAEDDSNMDTLTMFGFKPDPTAYPTNALRPGTNVVDPRHDLYVDIGDVIKKYKREKKLNNYYYAFTTSVETAIDNAESSRIYATTGFSPTGNDVDDYVARIYFTRSEVGGNIFLSIYDPQGKRVAGDYNTGGYVQTTRSMNMWDVEGLMQIKAGDFDGDGKDELAVYTPNNLYETTSGSVHNIITVSIFEFDSETNTITPKQSMDLTSKSSTNEICEWEYSHDDGEKQYYSLPYVSLSANDLNGDGIDDLMAVVSFSTYFRGESWKSDYTTAEILNHNTYFASVLEAYEGTNGGNLVQTVKHRVLVADDNGKNQYRYVLRNATATVGDITAVGSNNIVIAGNYTQIDYKASTDNSTDVNYDRDIEFDGNDAPKHVIGYTSYENLKKYATTHSKEEYNWTVQENGVSQLHLYSTYDSDPAANPTSVAVFAGDGFGHTDSIFVAGQIFKYSSEEGKIVHVKTMDDSNFVTSGCTNIWIGQAVAANYCNDQFGREMVVFPYYYKTKSKDNYGCKMFTYFQAKTNLASKPAYALQNTTIYENSSFKNYGPICLANADRDGKSSYITYEQGNTDVYFSDIEVLSIMQAPPLYEELNDDTYIGNSETGFAKSEGSSSATSHGGALTAGVVTGFEQESSFLGLFKVAGAEYELSITGTVSYDHETETSYNYSSGFSTTGTKDTAVIFTIPYVRYNCEMYVPEYTLPTKKQYEELCSFRDELTKNLKAYIETEEEQKNGSFNYGCDYYEYVYESIVNEGNYQDQINVLQKVEEEIDFIEKAIAECGKGGTGTWGGTVKGAILPYHYNVPQSPMVTTVDVETYDAIADMTPGLDKIYDNVFPEGYKAGDPSTYAHTTDALNAVGDVLQSKQSGGSSEDGFLTNSIISAAGSVQSQTISVEKSISNTIGWGAAIENTSVASLAGAKLGFTVTAEYNGSSVQTSTEGNEYSGAVVALPQGTPAQYSYGWKLVSYNAKLNGGKVPVVGYLTKMPDNTPPSIADDICVEDITDKSATITWKDGDRAADFYRLSRVYTANGEEKYHTIADNITSDNGTYSYTIDNLVSSNTSYYVLESFSYVATGTIASVPTDRVLITTFPENFSADISVGGFDDSVIYRNGKELTAKAKLTGTISGYDTLYQWQINEGKGWEDITGKTSDTFKFNISPFDNENKIRCSAIIVINDSSSYTLYSNPLELSCVNSVKGHSVDWGTDENSVTVKSNDDAAPAKIFLSSYTDDGVLSYIKVQQSSEDGVTFNLNEVNDDMVKLYLWNETMEPISKAFRK